MQRIPTTDFPTTGAPATIEDGFSFGGWTYRLLDFGQADDGPNIAHMALSGDVKQSLPWSRFDHYTQNHFRKFVELGLPGMRRRPFFDGLGFHFVNWSPEAIDEAAGMECAA